MTFSGPEGRLKASGEKEKDKFILRPETAESYFVLWRQTGDTKYRDWGWELVMALEDYCRYQLYRPAAILIMMMIRLEAGYSGVETVFMERPQHDDVQQSFFLAETLKYLYLLYSDSELLSLNLWVFNTEAHPLPVKGTNSLYRMNHSNRSSMSE